MVAKEKELQKKYEEVKNQSIVPSIEADATSISEAMSQVNMKDIEITGLKQQNQNLEEINMKRE